ncbi:MAG: peptide deformylase [Bacteroidia bacterium]
MILPIVAYGDPVLTTKATNISADYPQLKELIANMFETMYEANGVGLAAPQIGLSIRLFVIDASAYDEEQFKEEKRVFINAEILEFIGDEWAFNEGCLSIPEVRGDVFRPEGIRIRYFDENFQEHIAEFDDMPSRIIQHEYDHIEGKLFTEKLAPLRRRLVQKKLDQIKQGIVQVGYKMRFPRASRKK